MSDYYPDRWLVVKINSKDPHYRVFACWYGGYLGGDSWKMNSGIVSVTEDATHYHFAGSSGSVYSCNKAQYGASGYGHSVLSGMIDRMLTEQATVMDVLAADTNFMEIVYE
jgi:hypothetical protein